METKRIRRNTIKQIHKNGMPFSALFFRFFFCFVLFFNMWLSRMQRDVASAFSVAVGTELIQFVFVCLFFLPSFLSTIPFWFRLESAPCRGPPADRPIKTAAADRGVSPTPAPPHLHWLLSFAYANWSRSSPVAIPRTRPTMSPRGHSLSAQPVNNQLETVSTVT